MTENLTVPDNFSQNVLAIVTNVKDNRVASCVGSGGSLPETSALRDPDALRSPDNGSASKQPWIISMTRAFSALAALVAAGLFCTTASASFVVFTENFANDADNSDVQDGWSSSGTGTAKQMAQGNSVDNDVFRLSGPNNTLGFTRTIDLTGITGHTLSFSLAGGGNLDPPNPGGSDLQDSVTVSLGSESLVIDGDDLTLKTSGALNPQTDGFSNFVLDISALSNNSFDLTIDAIISGD